MTASGLRFLATGGLSAAVYLGGVAVLHRGFGLDPRLANVIGYVTATVVNYLLHFYWSFRSTRPHREAMWRFLVVTGAGVVLNALYVAAVLALFPVSVEVAGLTFMCLWPFVSFFALRHWALR